MNNTDYGSIAVDCRRSDGSYRPSIEWFLLYHLRGEKNLWKGLTIVIDIYWKRKLLCIYVPNWLIFSLFFSLVFVEFLAVQVYIVAHFFSEIIFLFLENEEKANQIYTEVSKFRQWHLQLFGCCCIVLLLYEIPVEVTETGGEGVKNFANTISCNKFIYPFGKNQFSLPLR